MKDKHPSAKRPPARLIVLRADDEGAALALAQKIATQTGFAVSVRDADFVEIGVISTPVRN